MRRLRLTSSFGALAFCSLASFAVPARAQQQDAPAPAPARSDGEVGHELAQKAKGAAREVNALLEDLRKKIDDFSRSSDPGAGTELAAIDAYVATARTIQRHCDEYLAEEPRLEERFKNLRAAYDRAIEHFRAAEESQRAKVEQERANTDLPPEDRERNARLRQRYAGLYAKNRALLEDERSRVDDWQKEMKRKFALLRAKSRLLARAIETAGLMKTIAASEAETRAFVEDVKKLNATLDGLLEDIAKSQLHEGEEPAREPAPGK